METGEKVDTSYEGLVDVLARHVHKYWRLDTHPNQIHSWSSSQYQIPAGVLAKLGILKPLDKIGARYAFTCTPDEFKRIATENKDRGCSYDTVVLALIEVTEIMYPSPVDEDLVACLSKLGVCAARTFDGPLPGTLIDAVGHTHHWPTDEVMRQLFERRANRPLWFKVAKGGFEIFRLVLRRVFRPVIRIMRPSQPVRIQAKQTGKPEKAQPDHARRQVGVLVGSNRIGKIPRWVRLSRYAWTEKKEHYEELGKNGKWAELIK